MPAGAPPPVAGNVGTTLASVPSPLNVTVALPSALGLLSGAVNDRVYVFAVPVDVQLRSIVCDVPDAS